MPAAKVNPESLNVLPLTACITIATPPFRLSRVIIVLSFAAEYPPLGYGLDKGNPPIVESTVVAPRSVIPAEITSLFDQVALPAGTVGHTPIFWIGATMGGSLGFL